jgi:hypothetical protein
MFMSSYDTYKLIDLLARKGCVFLKVDRSQALRVLRTFYE